jgi:uncharacterized protein YdhG (YjbR/CyaY superfamily)
MQSKAPTVAKYLASLPADRRAAVEQVRAVILKNLGKGYAEGMTYGMIGYFVPHSVYPPGYHCDPRQPLPFAGLASQKQHMSVYLMCIYSDAKREAELRAAFAKAGKKLDMGKACIRFKRVEDLELAAIGKMIRDTPVKEYVARYESLLAQSTSARKKPAASGTTAKAAKPAKAATKAPRKKAARPATAARKAAR